MVEIAYEPDLKEESRAAILDGLVAFNRSKTPEFNGPRKQVGLTLTDPETGRIDGGLTGRVTYGKLFVELLFVPERLRGQGVGTALMTRAEAVAREHGCNGILLDTFSFQAPGFYKKLGFAPFGEVPDYPPGHTRIFFHKTLS